MTSESFDDDRSLFRHFALRFQMQVLFIGVSLRGQLEDDWPTTL
jgi:hypothetical protein